MSEAIAEQLVEHVILRFGMPEIILTDKASNFNSDVMHKLLGIKKYTTSPYHPETNSGLERSHQILKNMLRAYTNKDKTDWPKLIPYAVFVMNTTVNRSTSYTAHELMYGHRASIPSNIKRKPEPIYSYDDYLMELSYKLQVAHEIARNKQIRCKILHSPCKSQKKVNSVGWDLWSHQLYFLQIIVHVRFPIEHWQSSTNFTIF